jgi:hypothetical protein
MTAAIIEPASVRRSTASDALLAALGCLAGCWTTIATRAHWFATVPAQVWLASYLMAVAVVFVAAYAAIRLHNLLPGPVSVAALKAEFPIQLQPYIAVAPATAPAIGTTER